MVADNLAHYNSLNVENLKALKTKHWVKRELTKFGDFNLIIKLYAEKRREHLKKTAKDTDRIFGILKDLTKNSEGQPDTSKID